MASTAEGDTTRCTHVALEDCFAWPLRLAAGCTIHPFAQMKVLLREWLGPGNHLVFALRSAFGKAGHRKALSMTIAILA